MIIVRPTLSLSKKMKIKLQPDDNCSDSLLGDWLSNNVTIYGKRYILSASSNTRLQIITKAAPYSSWTERLKEDLEQILMDLHIPQDLIKKELSHYEEIHFAKSNSRSIMGTVNDAIKMLKYFSQASDRERESIEALNYRLNEVPIMVEEETSTITRTRKIFGLDKLDRKAFKLRLV